MLEFVKEYKLTILTIVACFVIYFSQKHAYYKGVNDGIDIALDTCQAIVNKQIKADTNSVARVTIQTARDTNTFVLSSKKLNP